MHCLRVNNDFHRQVFTCCRSVTAPIRPGVVARACFVPSPPTPKQQQQLRTKHTLLYSRHSRPILRKQDQPFTLITTKTPTANMSDLPQTLSSGVVVTTSAASIITGFLLGLYAARGYLFVSPEMKAQREAALKDPVESEESDIDESDTILDHAPNWANGEEADRRQGLRASAKKEETKKPVSFNADEECKLVLVVRTDLGMTKGKIAAQCGHATLACYKTLTRAAARDPQSHEARLLRQWERHGQAKIAVQVKSEEDMIALMAKARALGVTAEVIQDAGRTQIEAGSRTVLGVGPAPKSEVDKITGGLKLL